MNRRELEQSVKNELMQFPWWNFGLDLVSDPATSEEWADELAYRIVERIGF